MKLLKLKQTKKLEFYTAEDGTPMKLPLYESAVEAGFPSPADDYIELKLDLNKHLIQNPSATFYVRVRGHSMVNAGISDGDMLIVDRSLEPKDGDVAVCVLNGEFTVKRIHVRGSSLFLLPENPEYPPLSIDKDDDFRIWGVVSYVIHKP
ncbi:MAG TPA: translesion error-prone DNA polymerase V autoproteolytic subunit [Candidatus Marinimicrobia bacterium]|nr:translesion error-prone DNA polymerase V autoproteolytic subunit [Candidatus Neomarinimicrobiota bacterium]